MEAPDDVIAEETPELAEEDAVPPARSWRPRLPDWRFVVPILGALLVPFVWSSDPGPLLIAVIAAVLVASVLAAVHHAEVIAHRVGEPFGTITLAIAVTAIEVALIVTLMAAGGDGTASLARDTVFAAVMITCNGILGVSVLIGALRDRVATFNAEGMATALATVTTLVTLSLVLPNFTTSTPGPEFSGAQLAFAAVASIVLYSVFLIVQTIRHRDFFVEDGSDEDAEADHEERPSNRQTLLSLAIMLVALVAVVGLTKSLSPAITDLVATIGAPISAVGVLIALLVLLPESLAAIRNARRGRVQTSLNLAFGSAIASIGLTIPVVAIASIWLPGPLVLGLEPTQIVMFALTVVVGALTVLPGRATVQEGALHLVLAGTFIFLALVP